MRYGNVPIAPTLNTSTWPSKKLAFLTLPWTGFLGNCAYQVFAGLLMAYWSVSIMAQVLAGGGNLGQSQGIRVVGSISLWVSERS